MLCGGGRLLAAGNGGSAAQAQHLTAELVGRYRTDRPPFSAIALHADTSSTTAIANDYGVDELFARQVRAHGRPGDVLILLSTSGASANLLSAAAAGRAAGLHVWALTGPAPNPLAAAADEAFCVAAPRRRPSRNSTWSPCTWCARPSTRPWRPTASRTPHPPPPTARASPAL